MAEEYETIIDFPHISIPPVNFKDGRWTDLWYEVMRLLIERTGGVDGDLIYNNTVDITTKADKTTLIVAGFGLDGGGSLASDVNLDVNTQEILDALGSGVGDIIIRTSLGWDALSAGDAGTVLTSNGPGVEPSWEAGGSCMPVVAAPTGLTLTDEECGTLFTTEL